MVVHVEFTIEPFVEGQPGLHVAAAIEAARARGVEVDVGPFGTACDVASVEVGDLVGAVMQAAFANGATHVTVHTAASSDASSATFGEGIS